MLNGEDQMAAAIRDVPITVQGSNLQLSTALSALVRAGVIRISTKYFGRLNGASVYFRQEGRLSLRRQY